MEENVFPLPEVQKRFEKFVLVRLYTDDEKFGLLQERLINVATLPSYVIMKPGTEEVVGVGSWSATPKTFIDFLDKGLSDLGISLDN